MNANALRLIKEMAEYAARMHAAANADFTAASGDSFKMAKIIGGLQGALSNLRIDAEVIAKHYGGTN